MQGIRSDSNSLPDPSPARSGPLGRPAGRLARNPGALPPGRASRRATSLQSGRLRRSEGGFIVRPGRVHAELPVEQRPREPQRARESERAIGEPQVEVEAERRPLHRVQGVQVDRDRAADDLVEEVLAKLDLALP